MTQFAVLLAGVMILAVSIVLSAAGNVKKTAEIPAIEKMGVNVGGVYKINEIRIPFQVRTESMGSFDVKLYSGLVQTEIRETPLSTSPVDGVSWAFPVIYRETSELGENSFELQLKPGTYTIAFTNSHGGESGIEVNAKLSFKDEMYPKLYDIGIQMLIVAVPLIVAGILS